MRPSGGRREPQHDSDRWEAVLLRAGLLPALVVTLVASVVAGALEGRAGATGAGLGGALGIGALGGTLVIARQTRRTHPAGVLLAALLGYTFTMTVLLLALVVVKRVGYPHAGSTGAGLLAVVLVWLPTQVRAFSRLRMLHVDPEAGPDGTRPDAGGPPASSA